MSIVTRLKSTNEIVVVLGRSKEQYDRAIVLLKPQAVGHSSRIETINTVNLIFSSK